VCGESRMHGDNGGMRRRTTRYRAWSLPTADGGIAVVPSSVVKSEVWGRSALAAERPLGVEFRYALAPCRPILFTNKAKRMKQSIGYVAVVVEDYDDAIKFYVYTRGFSLVEDTFIEAQNKRWVLVAPPGSSESKLLLARTVGAEQSSRIGNQTGGRVFLFLQTDNFWRDFNAYKSKGIVFVREPVEESYGTVAVFKDL
jgi:catechol 2,3-dioxygenase-like lactoylglutathione lyase family enzyme